MPAFPSAVLASTTTPVFEVDLNNAFGPVVIGLLLACGLFGASCVQTLMYFVVHPMDALLIKVLVVVNLLLCAADIVALSSVIYTDLIVHFGNVARLGVLGWGSHAEPLLTTLIIFLIQSFFLYRVFRFTKNWILVVVSVPFILVTLGLGLATVGRIFNKPSATSDAAEERVLHANDIFLALTDLLLAALMAYNLYQTKSGPESRVRSTDKVISTLIAYSIATGALTGAIAMIGFILAVADSTSTANQAMYAIIPHMYSNAMLASLNLRQLVTKPWRSGNAVELSGFRLNPDRSASEATQTTSTPQNSKVLQISLNDSEHRIADAAKGY